jgi:probable ATP-dependent RNA helicase DDX4
VATPGRLIDFVNQGLITFSSLRFIVFDEADRMLDMGFSLDIERLLIDNTMVSSVNFL